MSSLTQLHAPRPHRSRPPRGARRLVFEPLMVVAGFVGGIVAALVLAALAALILGLLAWQLVSTLF